MVEYTLKDMEAVKGKQSFDMLVKDGTCLFEEFENNVEAQYKGEIASLYAYMNAVANLQTLPNSHFHPYNRGDATVREFEFKKKHLRAYAIEKPGGKIVVLGGTKANQKNDQATFWKYKQQYIDSLNKKKL